MSKILQRCTVLRAMAFVMFLELTLISNAVKQFREKPTSRYVGRHGNFTWPRRELSANIEGHIVLGALHMVHERSEEYTCGPIMSQGGIQALETMLYTLDKINANPHILPSITLGMLAKDDCDRDIYGLEQAVDFIRGKLFLTVFGFIKTYFVNVYKPLYN